MTNTSYKIISLITDFGNKGQHYVACMKGVILKINPLVKIVDISHSVTPFSIIEGAYILKTTYNFFPMGTIFVGVIDPGVGSSRKIIVLQTSSKYYFIGPDNGLFTYILQKEKISKIIDVSNEKYFLKPVSDTFHGRDIMSPIAAYLSNGVSLDDFGSTIKLENIFKLRDIYPEKIENNLIKGRIQYIDSFGNCITNIELDSDNKSKDLGIQFHHNKFYRIIINNSEIICKYLSYYEELSEKDKKMDVKILKRDSFNFIEFSHTMQNFAEIFNISIGNYFYIKID